MLIVASVSLTGCFSGFGATTTMQASMNSGNGTQATAGAIRIENATIVLGPEGSKTGTLITTLVNTGVEGDTLVSASINGRPTYITPGTGAIEVNRAVNYGYDGKSWINTYDLSVPTSSYVPVVLQFEKAGTASFSALTVPAAGIYEGIAPNPATAPAA